MHCHGPTCHVTIWNIGSYGGNIQELTKTFTCPQHGARMPHQLGERKPGACIAFVAERDGLRPCRSFPAKNANPSGMCFVHCGQAFLNGSPAFATSHGGSNGPSASPSPVVKPMQVKHPRSRSSSPVRKAPKPSAPKSKASSSFAWQYENWYRSGLESMMEFRRIPFNSRTTVAEMKEALGSKPISKALNLSTL